MAITLSYAIMTHNERAEFGWLMESLRPFLDASSEIVVLDDYSMHDMVNYIKGSGARFYQRALNKNFGEQRNHLKALCRGEFIFVLDPDEIPPASLLEKLPQILDVLRREKLDGCVVPRLNIMVDGERPVDARTLSLSQKDMNAPQDASMRIIRNSPDIVWINRVHEKVTGVKRAGRLPWKKEYALLHVKTHKRLEGQVSFYRSIFGRHIDKFWKSVQKRLGIYKKPELVDIEAFVTSRLAS